MYLINHMQCRNFHPCDTSAFCSIHWSKLASNTHKVIHNYRVTQPNDLMRNTATMLRTCWKKSDGSECCVRCTISYGLLPIYHTWPLNIQLLFNIRSRVESPCNIQFWSERRVAIALLFSRPGHNFFECYCSRSSFNTLMKNVIVWMFSGHTVCVQVYTNQTVPMWATNPVQGVVWTRRNSELF